MGKWQEEKDKLDKKSIYDSTIQGYILKDDPSVSQMGDYLSGFLGEKALDIANLSPDVISYLNENFPNSSLTKKIDEYAYNIASDTGVPDRELTDWKSIFEPGVTYMEGFPEEEQSHYTGMKSSMMSEDPQEYMTEPNVLASYLGMDDPRFENQEDAPKFELSPYEVEESYLQYLDSGGGAGREGKGKWLSQADYMIDPFTYDKDLTPEEVDQEFRLMVENKADYYADNPDIDWKENYMPPPSLWSDLQDRLLLAKETGEIQRTGVSYDTYDGKMITEGDLFDPWYLKDTLPVNMGNFAEGLGYDPERDQYFKSVADVWDFDKNYSENWSLGRTTTQQKIQQLQADLMEAASSGNQQYFYDRFYIPNKQIEAVLNANFNSNKLDKGVRDANSR